jgi:chemotaxis protein methyltransferase CheR
MERRYVGFADAARVMRRVHGLDISPFSPAFVNRALEERRLASGCPTIAAYVERLAGDPSEAENLGRSLRVTYSEFFRNALTFAVLEQLVLPGLMADRERSGRHTIRVWCAGCSAGQEAWSVAILLDELATQRDAPPAYLVIATDISERDVTFARTGLYSAAAVGNVRLKQLATYFVRQGEFYSLAGRLRNSVDFSVYDLRDADTAFPPASVFGDFDVVLCCNLLLYYRPKVQRQMLEKLRRSLRPGGYLVTGETERQLVRRAGGFRDVAPPAPIFLSARS